MNREFIVAEITAAMRAHDKPRLSILRQVKNELDIKEKQDGRESTDEQVVGAVKKVLKQTSETLEGSVKAATNLERTEVLRTQVEILTAYLPQQLSGAELEALVERVIGENAISERRDMGRAIGLVVSEAGGNVDKAAVARIVGSRLT